MVEKVDNGLIYAMKQLRKDVIIKSDSLVCAKLEKEVLKRSHHPFLVGLDYVFQSPVNIYFVMKFYRFLYVDNSIEVENCTTICCHQSDSLKEMPDSMLHK